MLIQPKAAGQGFGLDHTEVAIMRTVRDILRCHQNASMVSGTCCEACFVKGALYLYSRDWLMDVSLAFTRARRSDLALVAVGA